MGQSASQPTLVENFDGKGLLDLSDHELVILLESSSWDKDSVLTVAKSIKQDQPQSSQPVSNGDAFYTREEDSPETELAKRIHDFSEEIPQIRFLVVPTRIKEPIFWKSILAILQERLDEYQSKHTSSTETSSSTPVETSLLQDSSHSASDASAETSEDAYRQNGGMDHATLRSLRKLEQQIHAKDRHISSLQSELDHLRETLQQAEAALSMAGSSSSSGSHRAHPAGEWRLTKDAQEFLAFPEEVKENMRKEKQRRLQQVQREMSFILDSDALEDSHGQWTCCGAKTYTSPCLNSKKR